MITISSVEFFVLIILCASLPSVLIGTILYRKLKRLNDSIPVYNENKVVEELRKAIYGLQLTFTFVPAFKRICQYDVNGKVAKATVTNIGAVTTAVGTFYDLEIASEDGGEKLAFVSISFGEGTFVKPRIMVTLRQDFSDELHHYFTLDDFESAALFLKQSLQDYFVPVTPSIAA